MGLLVYTMHFTDFLREIKLTNKIPYQLIMLPFLRSVSKLHFTHNEYNKQYMYSETYLDEIPQEWIECQQNMSVDNRPFIDVFKILASPGSSRRKVLTNVA